MELVLKDRTQAGVKRAVVEIRTMYTYIGDDGVARVSPQGGAYARGVLARLRGGSDAENPYEMARGSGSFHLAWADGFERGVGEYKP